MNGPMTHRWYWRKWLPERKDELCRVLVRGRGPGPRNILVEFADGARYVAPRFAVRATTGERKGNP